MKTPEEILTEIYKRSITHIEGHEKLKLGKGSMITYSETIEAMNTYASQFIHPYICYNCDGTGKVSHTECVHCKGAGKVIGLPTITTTAT